jgi:uncharacterized tellurite resistance protein B-like protein
MLSTLRDLLGGLLPDGPGQTFRPSPSLQMACAVLLVEVMRADPDTPQPERQAVMAALRRRFQLPDDELARLVAAAEEASRSAGSFYEFTSQINEALPQDQKIAIVETLWQVAYADGTLDAHENHVISRLAGLLNVTHGEFIAAKLHAKAAAGL